MKRLVPGLTVLLFCAAATLVSAQDKPAAPPAGAPPAKSGADPTDFITRYDRPALPVSPGLRPRNPRASICNCSARASFV